MTPEPVRVALLVIEALEELGLAHHVGGSFASSLHGVPRQTHDLDMVVALAAQDVPKLVARLQSEFYIEPEMILESLQRDASFNLIHLKTGFKIDVFPKGSGPFDEIEFERQHLLHLVEDPPREVMVKSAEDTILRKLQWYDIGGRSSDRQWNDVLGVLRTQAGNLNHAYMRRWARELEVRDLLEDALSEA